MFKKILFGIILCLCSAGFSYAQTKPPAPYGPVPTENQRRWQEIQGEFSNIKNNPSWQTRDFTPVKARYFKFTALKNTVGNNNAGYAEVDIITK